MANVLIIDDDPDICGILEELASRMACRAFKAYSPEQGMDLARHQACDLVFLDLQFPEGDGLDILPELLATPSKPEVIIITGSGVQGAELAFKHGAWDYVQKPFQLSEVSLSMSRVLAYRREKAASKGPVALKRSGIIGESLAITRCLDDVGKASATDAGVLITGETGTGKELFAYSIHENSRRSENCFIVVDCGSLPETLVEGILFGHEKGAFTGADSRKKGLVEQADGGTLFLDEIGELPLNTQKKLLRVFQEKRVRPLGAAREVSVDFRLVAATNRNLEEMAASSKFRLDLLFRIRAIEISLPPLRERKEDIRAIALHVIQRFCRQYDMGMKGVSREYFDVLTAQTWPGNVRELVNVLENSLATAIHDPMLIPKHVPYQYRAARLKKEASGTKAETDSVAVENGDADLPLPLLNVYRDDCEKRYLHRLLELANGDRVKACTLSGISMSRLYSLLKKHNLSSFKH